MSMTRRVRVACTMPGCPDLGIDTSREKPKAQADLRNHELRQ
jgi:hypothetical protein